MMFFCFSLLTASIGALIFEEDRVLTSQKTMVSLFLAMMSISKCPEAQLVYRIV